MSEIYAPVTGTVSARNERSTDEPELINSDPYGDGWLVEITPTDGADLSGLLDAAAYTALTVAVTRRRSSRTRKYAGC